MKLSESEPPKPRKQIEVKCDGEFVPGDELVFNGVKYRMKAHQPYSQHTYLFEEATE